MNTAGEVRNPDIRKEVMLALQHLSDPEYQQRVWVDRKFPTPSYYSDFLMAMHMLYDDTGLARNAYSEIGSTLKDETEARLIQTVIEALEEVFGETGEEDFEVVRTAPGWPSVLAAAAATWKAMSTNP